MKTATFPSLRAEPELRQATETVLREGESLSSFLEASVRANIERRQSQCELVARGLASRDEARRTGKHFTAEEIHVELDAMLAAAERKAGLGIGARMTITDLPTSPADISARRRP